MVHTSLEQNTALTTACRHFHRNVCDTLLTHECKIELLSNDFIWLTFDLIVLKNRNNDFRNLLVQMIVYSNPEAAVT